MTNRTTRRRFLAQIGAISAVGATTPFWFDVISHGLPFAWGAGETEGLPGGTPICLHIALDGGNDYLNTLAPIEDGFYNSSTVGHGSIALTPADTLALGGTNYRLHKNLAWLANRWNTTGDVAFALGVGNTQNSFSHFVSMRFWETAQFEMPAPTGWLGRYADLTFPQNPLASVSIADLRREAMGATAATLVVNDCAGFGYQPHPTSSDVFLAGARQMATIPGPTVLADVARMIDTTFQVGTRVKGAADANLAAVSGDSLITQRLLQAAQLIRAGIPSQTYAIGFRQFDSHKGQRAMQNARFNELNQGLTKFFAALSGHERARDVFVLITSEFGRQCTVNNDLGTDHGQAGMAVFIGSGVKRGIYGQAPTLDPGGPTRPNRLNDAPKPTVDFRTVHATALARLAKGDGNVADAVLRGHYEDLGVFSPYVAPASTTTIAPATSTTAPNKPPVAVMALSNNVGAAPFTVTATSSGSNDPDGSIVSYVWHWADATPDTRGATATHTFTRRGTYSVRLTVTDDRGATAATSKTVRVA